MVNTGVLQKQIPKTTDMLVAVGGGDTASVIVVKNPRYVVCSTIAPRM